MLFIIFINVKDLQYIKNTAFYIIYIFLLSFLQLFLIYRYFKVLCVKTVCFSFMVSSFAFMFRYSSLPYTPQVIFSSGSFIVYVVIQSKLGIFRNGKDFHAHFPGLGECFRTVSIYVWNVHLRNWFKIHNLREWNAFQCIPNVQRTCICPAIGNHVKMCQLISYSFQLSFD